MQTAPAAVALQSVDVPPSRPRLRPWIRRPAFVAAGLGVLGTLFRLALVAADYPGTDSDEATVGLGALHVASGQHFPIFFYGQHYMGTIQSYLAAPLLVLGGPSTLLLRLPLILLYAGFLVAMYRLVAAVYSAWFAVLAVGVLSLGSDRVLKDQLIAHGGTAEVKPAAAVLLLLAYALAHARRWHRASGFFLWGLVTGLCLWEHLVIVPYVMAAAGVLVACRGRELVGRMGGYLCAGLVVGAAPLIAYNLRARPAQDSLSIFLRQNDGSPVSLSQRVAGGALTGVPLSTGMCGPGACRPWQQAWAPVCLALLVASAVLAVRALRRTPGDRARQLVRLALVLGALLSIVVYARSPAAGLTPMESGRYLCCLPVSVPAILWPLWRLGVGRHARTAQARLAMSGLVAVLVAMSAMTIAVVVAAVPGARAEARDQRELVETLREAGVRHLYASYWTCNRISFGSGETITCAVLDDELHPGLDRYLPYRAAVAADPRPAYVFVANSPPDIRLREVLSHRGMPDSPVRAVGRYRVYQPATRISP
ncbi:hypothetical protein HC028_07590 [Planosporangium flavigriseum]|uniref:4-amino-4-deoxy-L-arabinose transferase n=1 Tax=Planosporangium flavigriseum TaxID=373681 RepID=A0A8J3PNG3_9ACTN|nr:hypothetical protein [Planosporangium flavigriseum]NJC64374.1 hypothetical protein [Planosporangium flavigriseum]GIG73901.1 hypothetical protein Pfl04_23050 [Planosporangium flavigriseum]